MLKPLDMSEEEFADKFLTKAKVYLRQRGGYDFDSIMLEDIGLSEDQISALAGGTISFLFLGDTYYVTPSIKREMVKRNYKVFRITLLAKEEGE